MNIELHTRFFYRIVFSISCFSLLFSYISIEAKEKYWVFFSDKKGVLFDPSDYFEEDVLSRKISQDFNLYDSIFFPVNEIYKKEVISVCGELVYESRWLNAVCVFANSSQINTVKEFSFVSEVSFARTYRRDACDYRFKRNISQDDLQILKDQTSIMGKAVLEEHKLDGKGIRIAIFDAGFPGVDKSPVFKHIRDDNRIIATYDFVKEQEFVYAYNKHGTMVMSCIGGIIDGRKIGLATGAEFLLARTEILSERFVEEENWLAAVEWAYRNGADIINSSLGYTHPRYFEKDMDGSTSLVSKAANMAASKGMLVVNAMGNDGDNLWEYLGTPADADSVLAVGGIDPCTNYHISFSSFGPSADMRIKPNVVAYGRVITSNEKKMTEAFGTSFSAPLVTGYSACIMQAFPQWDNMRIFQEIEKSGSLYPYFDYAHGYGVPQAGKIFKDEQNMIHKTFHFEVNKDSIKVLLEGSEIQNTGDDYLYYHIQNSDGKLEKYAVLIAKAQNVIEFDRDEYPENYILRVHYRGFTNEFIF